MVKAFYMLEKQIDGISYFAMCARVTDPQDGSARSLYPGPYELWEHKDESVIIHPGEMWKDRSVAVTRCITGMNDRVKGYELVVHPDGCKADDLVVLVLKYEQWAREGVVDAIVWLYQYYSIHSRTYLKGSIYGLAALAIKDDDLRLWEDIHRTLRMEIGRYISQLVKQEDTLLESMNEEISVYTIAIRQRNALRQKLHELESDTNDKQWRSYIDFAESLKEPRGWARMKGEAEEAFNSIRWT